MTYWNKIIFCIKLLMGRVNIDAKGKFISPGNQKLVDRKAYDDMELEASKYVIAASYIGGIGRFKDFVQCVTDMGIAYKPNLKT